MNLRNWLARAWQEDDGILSFEWTLLVVLLVFGIVAGLCAARDGIIDELSDQAAAILALDQSYSFAGFGPIMASQYTDTLGTVSDCSRGTIAGQDARNDGVDGG